MGKVNRLERKIEKLGSVLVAFSGGVDSSFLIAVVSRVLDSKNILAVTAVSETYTGDELGRAKKIAKSLGVRHKIIRTNELKNKKFSANPLNRCYYCKTELFKKLKKIARDNKLKYVIDASNIDDEKDYRPGTKAKKELRVKSPLQDARITKKDIRRFSRRMGLETWDFPSMACLASRVPYGTIIKKSILVKIEKAEGYIRKQGIKQVRVRYYGDLAKIEVEKKDIKRFLNKRFCDKIIKHLKFLGFCYIVLDLEGYRTGSLNKYKGIKV